MAHDHHHHAHGHHHHAAGHGHAPASFGRAFAIGTVLNLAFVVIEAAYGLLSGSIALIADAGHNLSDIVGLLMAWVAYALAQRAPSDRFTYGLRSSSILAALANAVLLLVAVGAIAFEAVQRLRDPVPVGEVTIMLVAGLGIAINLGTAMLFASGRKGDLNIRGAYQHMAADAAVSLGVVVAGALIWLTGWLWIDPAVSLAIAGVIVWGTWSLLRESLELALHAVPPGIDAGRVRAHLAALPGVRSVHDLHIWPMSTTETALTAHLVMPAGHPGDAFLARLRHELAHEFGIGHATVQIEIGDTQACELAPESVV
ncbi:MAG: cation diffusion facilitator family transporter [Hyphomicrobiaceae bacterium]|nr:cation diffusion facilitator family transporter [Hyphomicrobiaceae bacterium]